MVYDKKLVCGTKFLVQGFAIYPRSTLGGTILA